MTEELPPFRVEVEVRAPRDVVWRALSDPAEIRRWFGWEYDGLDEEIAFIFVEHAEQVAPERLEMEADQVLSVEQRGPVCVVRVVHPGDLGEAGWDDVYSEVGQGWRMFLEQLRHALERHPGEERRTVALTGVAVAADVLAQLAERAPGELRHEGRFHRAVALEDHGGGLVGVLAERGLASEEPGKVLVVLTTYGLDDAALARLREEWEAWWEDCGRDGR